MTFLVAFASWNTKLKQKKEVVDFYNFEYRISISPLTEGPWSFMNFENDLNNIFSLDNEYDYMIT